MGPTNKKLIFLWLSPSPPYSLLGCRLASRDKQNSWFKILANLQRRREYGGEGDNQRKISFLFVGPICSYLDYMDQNRNLLKNVFPVEFRKSGKPGEGASRGHIIRKIFRKLFFAIPYWILSNYRNWSRFSRDSCQSSPLLIWYRRPPICYNECKNMPHPKLNGLNCLTDSPQ